MNNDNQSPGRSPMGETHIERIVMRRVHLIRILGLIISTVVLAVLTAVVALWGIGREVWVARVFENAPRDFAGLAGYLVYAFAQTNIVVQALTVLTFISLLFLVRETVRALSPALFSPRA